MTAATEAITTETPTQARAKKLNPKNGKFLVALLAGGTTDARDRLRKALADRGMLVRYHWDYERAKDWQRAIPPDVDVVLYVKTAAGHDLRENLKARVEEAKRAGHSVTVIATSHKWANVVSILQYYHINTKAPWRLPPDELEKAERADKAVAWLATSNTPASALRPSPDLKAKVMAAIEAERPGTTVSLDVQTPAMPSPVPPAALSSPPPSRVEPDDPELRAARLKAAKQDTMTLIRELQARLHTMGLHAILVGLEEVTFSTEKPGGKPAGATVQ